MSSEERQLIVKRIKLHEPQIRAAKAHHMVKVICSVVMSYVTHSEERG